MDRIVRINVTKVERTVTLNVVSNVTKIIVSQNSSGGGSGIVNITSTGNTITITGTGTRNIEIEASLLALIISAIQSGDNVSELLNDAGYITLGDIPTFDPADYDLDNFTNVSTDPFARTSELATKTSDLVNDGEDGTSLYVTADQLPSNLNLFATNVSSDIATYFKLVTSIDDPDYNDTAVDIPTGAITTTGQFIAALATTANVLVGNPGIINLLTIGNVRRTAGTGTAEFYYEVYHRDSTGTETLIATSTKTPPVSAAIYTEFLAAALLNNGVFLATDRIVVKYYADRIAGGSNPSYDFQFGGTSPVRTTFPVPASNIPLDATPTDGSANAVSSNGVFDALALKQDVAPNDDVTYSLKNGGLVDTTDLLNLPFNVRNAFVSLFQYNLTQTNITFSSNASNSNNQCHWMPFQVGRSIEIDSFSIINNALNASSGANSVTLYIFDNSNDGLPGVKVHQEISSLGVLDTSGNVIDFNNNIILPRGNYWIGLHLRGLNGASANPTFVGSNSVGLPSIQVSALSFTNNNNYKLITISEPSDIGNNPIVQSTGSTSISYPIVYIKSILI